MAKAGPRETTGRPGPVRTSSGTRVAAARLTPVQPPAVASPRGANDDIRETLTAVQPPAVASPRGAYDISETPTRELDLEQLRAMALRCASDVGQGEQEYDAAPMPAADKPSRPRLELVLAEDERPLDAIDADRPGGRVDRSRRPGVLALVVVLLVLALATLAALEVYGLLP